VDQRSSRPRCKMHNLTGIQVPGAFTSPHPLDITYQGLHQTTYQLVDLTLIDMPTCAYFRINELVVYGHFKLPPIRRDQRNGLDLEFIFLKEFHHQTDGVIGVVSDSTVFNGDVEHGCLL
jgi:hypothetical protein